MGASCSKQSAVTDLEGYNSSEEGQVGKTGVHPTPAGAHSKAAAGKQPVLVQRVQRQNREVLRHDSALSEEAEAGPRAPPGRGAPPSHLQPPTKLLQQQQQQEQQQQQQQLQQQVQEVVFPPGRPLQFSRAASTPVSGAERERFDSVADAEGHRPFQPHDFYANGCPAPACEPDRIRAADGINAGRVISDPDIECALRLICMLFETQTAALTLLTSDAIYVPNAMGALAAGICPARWGFCGWSFLNPNHELLAIENLSEDARFSENLFVKGDCNLQFYIAAPLVSRDGHRLGTLCICDQKPRKFDATRATVLANVSEMVVRQLERKWAIEAEKDRAADMLRSLAAYSRAYLFVDTSGPTWRIMHMNDSAAAHFGVAWERQPAPFWELINVPGGAQSRAAVEEAAAKGGPFTVEGARCRNDIGSYYLAFQPATGSILDDDAFPLGVPSFLDDDPSFGASLYFVDLQDAPISPKDGTGGFSLTSGSAGRITAGSRQSSNGSSGWMPGTGSTGSSASGGARVQAQEIPFPGLTLGALLGKGSFGNVYRGKYLGNKVAVKITADMSRLKVDEEGVPLEAAITANLTHRGLVKSLTYAFADHPDSLTGAIEKRCWLLLEYCDQGCLVDGVVKGWFRQACTPLEGGGANMRAILTTAAEVAAGMAFLHQRDIVHGDLTGGNVMLTSCPANPHGFCAKVGDFGMSRNLDLTQRIQTNTYGTVTHMPPEVLMSGNISKAADVYAFGVLLWEMYTGTRAWAGLMHAHIMCQVTVLRRSLEVPPSAPPALQRLLTRCLAHDPAQRPTFDQILTDLPVQL